MASPHYLVTRLAYGQSVKEVIKNLMNSRKGLVSKYSTPKRFKEMKLWVDKVDGAYCK